LWSYWDTAIQAGQGGRLLSHNLIFEALAPELEQLVQGLRQHGPADHVAGEMDG